MAFFAGGQLSFVQPIIPMASLTRIQTPWEGALHVGATIEDLDILDIQVMLTNTSRYNLINVYENLMKGSRNHLRSYGGLLLSLYDYKYQAQYLTQEEVDAIISSEKETGRF